MSDVRIANGRTNIILKRTKTIQMMERELEIPLPILGDEICPTEALMQNFRDRKSKGHADTPLFVIDEFDTPLTDFIFRKEFKLLL